LRPVAASPPPAAPSSGGPKGAPPLDMIHTRVVGAGKGGEVLRKAAADVDVGGDQGQTGQAQRDSGLETSHQPTPPQDLSVLVNQLYAEIKRELIIERERRGGIY
ncbi:MAG: hypothetical protein D6731_21620, partial [Planctomycetota bacterium]